MGTKEVDMMGALQEKKKSAFDTDKNLAREQNDRELNVPDMNLSRLTLCLLLHDNP